MSQDAHEALNEFADERGLQSIGDAYRLVLREMGENGLLKLEETYKLRKMQKIEAQTLEQQQRRAAELEAQTLEQRKQLKAMLEMQLESTYVQWRALTDEAYRRGPTWGGFSAKIQDADRMWKAAKRLREQIAELEQ